MKYKVIHSTQYSYSQSVPICHNLIHLRPRNELYQNCDQFSLLIHPEPLEIIYRKDYFGNNVAYFSIDHAHMGLSVTSNSVVSVDQESKIDPEKSIPWNDLVAKFKTSITPDLLDHYQYAFESPGIHLFPELKEYASGSFPQGRPIIQAALDLTHRIHKDFKYDSRATTVHTPVREVFKHRHGVCQDFAHLQIACLRTLGIPARYVSGYLRTNPPPGKQRLIGADASHAWVSVYCDQDGWVDFDPTNSMMISSDHITVAWGRDYYDVCPIQGTIIGGDQHRMKISVDVEPLTDEVKS